MTTTTTAAATILSALPAAIHTDDAGGGLWLPPKMSTIAGPVDWVFWFIYWICVFFFILNVGLMIWFALKYRRTRPTQKAEPSPTHNTPLELTWTIIPLILVIAIFYIGLVGYVDMVTPPKNAYEVNVTAQQWSWQFEHRNGATDSTWLKVPAGRPVKLTMTSNDVLHALYVPAFRVKQDVVPGRYTYLWFQADDPGVYQLFCAEYCGTDHSQMAAYVKVLSEAEFERELQEDANWFDEVPDERLADAGYAFYPRCASCHTLDGSPKIGPSFLETHQSWGQTREFEGGGAATIDENYIRDSLLNPQGQVAKGYPKTMPTFAGQLSERQIRAMAEFIKHLPDVVDEQGNPKNPVR